MSDDRGIVAGKTQSSEAVHPGLANLAAAVAGAQGAGTWAPALSGHEAAVAPPQVGDLADLSQVGTLVPDLSGDAAALAAERMHHEHLVAANQRWEVIAEELTRQLRSMERERDAIRRKFAGLIMLSAVLAAWGLTATVLLRR